MSHTIEIVNGFGISLNSDPNRKHKYSETYKVNNLIHERGDFRLFSGLGSGYVIAYKNVAIAELAGPNEELVGQLHEDNGSGFLFDRAKGNIERFKELVR